MTDCPQWFWWSSTDEEHYDGPFKTRAQAVAELDGEPGWVCEAHQASLRLADFVDAEAVLERAEDLACDYSNEDADTIFEPSPEQTADLDARIKSAVNDWQDAHGLRFIPWSFTEMRNKEKVA